MLQKLEYVLAWWAAWHMHMHAEFTSTSELPFASLEQVLVLNVSHENDLIFMRMNVQLTYIFIPIVSHKDPFYHIGKIGYSSMSCSGSLWFMSVNGSVVIISLTNNISCFSVHTMFLLKLKRKIKQTFHPMQDNHSLTGWVKKGICRIVLSL